MKLSSMVDNMISEIEKEIKNNELKREENNRKIDSMYKEIEKLHDEIKDNILKGDGSKEDILKKEIAKIKAKRDELYDDNKVIIGENTGYRNAISIIKYSI